MEYWSSISLSDVQMQKTDRTSESRNNAEDIDEKGCATSRPKCNADVIAREQRRDRPPPQKKGKKSIAHAFNKSLENMETSIRKVEDELDGGDQAG